MGGGGGGLAPRCLGRRAAEWETFAALLGF